MGSLNKSQLINKMSEELKITRTDTEMFLNCFIDTVQKHVKKGHDIRLTGFGTFTKYKRKARMGRNPRTGKEIKIPATWCPKLKPGSEFKALCN